MLKIARQPFYRWLKAPITAAEPAEAYRANALFNAHRDDRRVRLADVSDMEYFLDQAKIILPVLGVNHFRSVVTPPSPAPSQTGPRTETTVFEMTLKRLGLTATAREVDGELTVLEGSRARSEWAGVDHHSYVGLRATLQQDGTLVLSPYGALLYFTRNYVFNSPSDAAAIVAGQAANGRTEWLVQ